MIEITWLVKTYFSQLQKQITYNEFRDNREKYSDELSQKICQVDELEIQKGGWKAFLEEFSMAFYWW